MLEALFLRFGSKVIPPPSEFSPPTPPTWHRIATRPLGKPSVPLFAAGTPGPSSDGAASSSTHAPLPAGAKLDAGTDQASRKRNRGEMSAPGVATSRADEAGKASVSPSHGVEGWAQAVGARAMTEDEAASLKRLVEGLVGLEGWVADGCDSGRAAARLNDEAMRTCASGAWLVSWVPQGERCVVIVSSNMGGTNDGGTAAGGPTGDDRPVHETFVLTAHGRAWQLPRMQWPKAAPSTGAFAPPAAQHESLVLLGDIVCDVAPGLPSVFRLLVSDVLNVGGEAASKMPLTKRLGLLESKVLGPRKGEAAVAAEKLRVRQRDHFKLGHVAYLVRRFLPKLTHRALGICFLDSSMPFQPGPTARGIEWRREDSGGVSEAALLQWADSLGKG